MPTKDRHVTDSGNLATAGRGRSLLARVTVNLNPRSWRALESTAKLTGDTRTDICNRALQVYGYLEEILHANGSVYVRDSVGGDLERLKIF
jgi:hypothetical protein